MSLRKKTLLVIAITLSIQVVLFYSISERVLMKSFETLERQAAQQNVNRVQAGLETTLDFLSEKAYDWSHWDDMYAFVQDARRDGLESEAARAFIRSNFDDTVFTALKINFLLVFPRAGAPLFQQGFDLTTGRGMPVPQSLLRQHLVPGSPALTHQNAASVARGLLLVDDRPLLLVSHPIVDSRGQSEIRGTLIFGRYLDDAEVRRLSRLTLLPIELKRLDAPDLPAGFRAANAAITPGGQVFTEVTGEDRMAGYTRIRDLYGRPILLARVELPRDISREGRFTAYAFLIATLVSGIGVGILAMILLERIIISRVRRLSHDVQKVGSSADLTARVRMGGQDELTSLAGSINRTLEQLEHAQRQIQERKAEMRLILDTMPAGLLSLDEHLRINPTFSRAATRLLGDELAGQSWIDALQLDPEGEDTRLLREFLDIFRQKMLPEESLADLNPLQELRIDRADGGQTWLKTRYTVVERGPGQPAHVLAVLEDVTREKRMAEQMSQSSRENQQLRAIAGDPDLFREFLVEVRSILQQLEADVARLDGGQGTGREVVHEIFRGVHTIKGTAGAFGLIDLSTVAGAFEESLSELRGRAVFSGPIVAGIRDSLRMLFEAFSEVLESTRPILGDEIEDVSELHLRVPLRDVRRIEQRVALLPMAGESRASLLADLQRLCEVPIERSLSRTTRVIPDLIQRLRKQVNFRFEHHGVAADLELGHELNRALIHLIRNAIDHGIELPEVRRLQGKPSEGEVRLEVHRDAGRIRLDISDDGAGIDPDRIRRVALERGLLTEAEATTLSVEACYSLIFRPGFSTADQVSDISGRGVGMDAVLDTVEHRLGGKITIESETARGTHFHIQLPLQPPGSAPLLSIEPVGEQAS